MARAGRVARALVSRTWWWVTLIVIALMIVLARLGIWQLDRLDQRRAANAQLLAALESAPIHLNSEFSNFDGLEPENISSDLENRDVMMTGEYDFANQRYLKLQNLSGRAGVHLITPFLLENSDSAVLVDRGWIPDADYEAGMAYDEQSGLQTIDGYVALTETIRRRTAESTVPVSPGLELFRVDISAIQDELPYSLVPFYVIVNPPDGAHTELPIATAKESDISEGSHLSYAIQWFIFSVGLGLGYLIYVNQWTGRQSTPEYKA